MKKLLFWMFLIVGIVALIGSCAKKSDTSSTTTPTTYVTTDTGASGSITVGSETMSGTYVSACMISVDSMISGGALPSDTKGWGGAIIVTGNDNVTEEKRSYTDTSCTTSSHIIKTVYDNVSVGSASGSNYPLSVTKASQAWTVNTTPAETWLEAMFSGAIDLTVGTELNNPYTGSSNPRFGNINLTSTTLQWADVDKTATPSIDGALKYTKL